MQKSTANIGALLVYKQKHTQTRACAHTLHKINGYLISKYLKEASSRIFFFNDTTRLDSAIFWSIIMGSQLYMYIPFDH